MSPVFQPAPAFNFSVFMLDAGPLPSTAGEIAFAATALGVAAGQAALFGAFSEVTGLAAELEIEPYQEGGRNAGARKLMKWGKYHNLVLRRGVTFSTDIWDWYYQVLYGTRKPMRKDGIVVLNDRGGVIAGGTGSPIPIPVLDRTPVAVWYFANGLPARLEGPALNARSNEIAIERLEIAHERLVRLGPAMLPGVGETLARVGL